LSDKVKGESQHTEDRRQNERPILDAGSWMLVAKAKKRAEGMISLRDHRDTEGVKLLEWPEQEDRLKFEGFAGGWAPTAEDFLPICLPAMANSHNLDGLNLFVNFINDSAIADSDPPVIL
jgi:hypothetical protein